MKKLRNLGQSILIGSIPAGIFSAALRVTFIIAAEKIVLAASYPFESLHTLRYLAIDALFRLYLLPITLLEITRMIISGEFTKSDKTILLDWSIWRYQDIPQTKIIIAWFLLGALAGIALLSWAKSPFKRFLKINAVLFMILLIGLTAFSIDRTLLLHKKAINPIPPDGFHEPLADLPRGFSICEVTRLDLKTPQSSAPQSTLNTGSGDSLFEGKILTSRSDQNVDYRLIFNYEFLKNDPAETFEYYSSEKRCPWPYSLWVKKKREHVWRLLGPFLPGLGTEHILALDSKIEMNLIKNTDLRWILRECDPHDDYSIWRPAHLRPIKDRGKAWLCSLPLSAFTDDADGDGLSDIEEAALLTDPQDPDSDGDGIIDGQDTSPLGWFKDSVSREAINLKIIEYIIQTQEDNRIIIGKPLSLCILNSPGPRYQINCPGKIVLTLSKKEETIFRNRNGIPESTLVCTFQSAKSRPLFFGLFGVSAYEEHCFRGGVGFIAICLRSLNKNWKPIQFMITWVS
jgi:hypothetical protein